MLFAAGGGARVVGTPEFSVEPEAARAIARVGEYTRRHGSQVSAFYGSNVQTYLGNQQLLAFCRSLAALPHDPHRSAFIHSEGPEPFRDKLASCTRRVHGFR